MSRPIMLGLTGSIGMGKSTVAAMFEKHGVAVFDADAEVRKMQQRGGALVAPIEAAFPGSTGVDGVLREKLGEQVFGDKEALARLEAIVHPAVAEKRKEFLLEHGGQKMVLFDIPLLFERGGNEAVDRVIVVSAPAQVQRERVLAREGMTAEKFARILEHQLADEEKRRLADHVIDTGTSLEKTEDAVVRLIDEIGRQTAG